MNPVRKNFSNGAGEIKSQIRKEILKQRDALSEKEVREKSLLIKESLFSLRQFQEAKFIMFYASFRNEVRTREMIEEGSNLGKKIALPVTLKKDKIIKPYLVQNLQRDLVCGSFGIPEPKIDKDREVDIRDIDMILVPGIAFDKRGRRIGFGRGFYDRFLYSLRTCTQSGVGPFCAGLAFEMQMVEDIPVEKHDERVDIVITESRIYENNL